MTLAWFIVLMCCAALPLAVWFGIQIGREQEKAARFDRMRSYTLQEEMDNEPSSKLRR